MQSKKVFKERGEEEKKRRDEGIERKKSENMTHHRDFTKSQKNFHGAFIGDEFAHIRSATAFRRNPSSI